MKVRIVIVSMLAVCMLMMLPSISAVEFNTALESNKPHLFEKFSEKQRSMTEKNQLSPWQYLLMFLLDLLSIILCSILWILIELGILPPPPPIRR